MELNSLLEKCRHDISIWLEQLAADLEPGRFRFCLKGSKVPVQGHAAQVSTCFAMKIAWQAGIWQEWSNERQSACIAFVKSFQQHDGFFHDPWIAENATPGLKNIASAIIGNKSWRSIFDRKKLILRAETRQSASTLSMVDSELKYPLPFEVSTKQEAIKYISSFDWFNPWAAGSHLSHLLTMLSINWNQFGKPHNYNSLVDTVLQYLKTIQDPVSGTWFQGKTPDNIKINGAMKVFSGLQWVDYDYPDTRRIVDFALMQPFGKDGCGFLNRLFAVQQALKGAPSGYKRDAVQFLADRVFEEVMKFRKNDGAFSFFINKSQMKYYFANVSSGYPISDLHGTVMMTWAISTALDLKGDSAPLGAEFWRCHKA